MIKCIDIPKLRMYQSLRGAGQLGNIEQGVTEVNARMPIQAYPGMKKY